MTNREFAQAVRNGNVHTKQGNLISNAKKSLSIVATFKRDTYWILSYTTIIGIVNTACLRGRLTSDKFSVTISKHCGLIGFTRIGGGVKAEDDEILMQMLSGTNLRSIQYHCAEDIKTAWNQANNE